MKYAEKLRDPRWQRKRLEIMERDRWECRDCHSKEKTLTVHHHFYLRTADPWEYPDYLLSTLCQDCHEERQPLEEAALASVAKQLRHVPKQRLESVAWNLIQQAIREADYA